ncbi:MAG: thioredoxin, partial [Candidatus Hydrothermarchaeales archaeon]
DLVSKVDDMDELDEIKKRRIKELMDRIDDRDRISAPITITDGKFGQVIKKYGLIVVDCWAPWCAPCRMLAPIIDELANDYAGKVVFGKLNTDENPNTSARFGIRGIPTLLIFKGGREVERIIGAVPKQMIESKLNTYLG